MNRFRVPFALGAVVVAGALLLSGARELYAAAVSDQTHFYDL